MKTKKRYVTIITAMISSSFLLAACGGGTTTTNAGDKSGPTAAPSATAITKANGPKLSFRLAETHPADYPTTLGDKRFAELVNQASDGRIKIDVYPASQLGEEKAVIEQVQLGAIEFTRVSTGALGGFNKQYEVFSLPYLFDNDEHQWRFLESEQGTKLLDSLEASRMKGLAYYSSGARHFYSKKPVKSITDLKGLKIRVIQNKVNIDLMNALGANATPMPYGDVFNALQTGIIDAAENNYPSYFSSNHFQQAKHLILDQHQRVPEVLLISKVAWDKLSAEDKALIKKAALDSVKTQKEEWAKFEKDSETKVRAAGVTITEVSDLKSWQEAVKPVIDKYRNDYKDTLEAIEKTKK
ncbi:TRAP transporter substrate-binding protein [Paenibacillus sp. SYP-B3998]|uniref:TRAP transporter substrate-binding protein n=1 Tax=Paenibacillus sp. SYP-B3998 TaxID=2678564 RepID=A0A6G3ZST3_9BACL|nr:TRAP transporter substrate-binding protein [Paenibacillus sp. SYP-B3998]NEW05120.1 TRAP transporter substrate-binding protein [Paenibacillus sp. SYP-B3998]